MLLKHALEFSKPNLSRVQKRQIYQKKQQQWDYMF